MPATDLAQQRFRRVAAMVAALAQWPLAATLLSTGAEPFTKTDSVGIAAVVAGLTLWLVALRGPAAAALMILGSLGLTAGAYLCMRGVTLGAWLGFGAVLGLLTTTGLAFMRPGVAAKLALVVTILFLGGILGEAMAGRVSLRAGAGNVTTGSFTGQIEGPDRQAFAQLLPLSTGRARKTKPDGSVDFDVEYHTDAAASRVVPNRPEGGGDVYLFGCSFTFGEGLTDDQTVAARLQEIWRGRRLYDFGIRNAGTSDAWIHLRRKLRSGARPVWCIYLFMDDHFRRAGLPDVTAATQEKRPRVVMKNSEPVLLGRAGDTFPTPAEAFRVNLAGRSRIYRSLASRWSPDERVIDLLAGLGKAMHQESETHGSKFLFVIFASNGPRYDAQTDRMREKLEARGVTVLDCRPLLRDHLARTGLALDEVFFADSHPRANHAKLVAQWIDEKIGDAAATQPAGANE